MEDDTPPRPSRHVALMMLAFVSLLLLLLSPLLLQLSARETTAPATPDPKETARLAIAALEAEAREEMRMKTKAALEVRKIEMLARANLTGQTDPGLRFQAFSEILNAKVSHTWHGKQIFAEFMSLIVGDDVKRFGKDPMKPESTNVAFFKTHKTGSTTLASVLYRYSARHRLSILNLTNGSVIPSSLWPVYRMRLKAGTSNMVFKHLSGRGDNLTVPLSTVFDFYSFVIKEPAILSILRDPISQTLSWICFYLLPEDIAGVEQMIEKIPSNIQCAEFGIKTPQQLDSFLANELNVFKLMCVSERFDECMVMMRRKLNWDMLDITYLRVNDGDEVR
jgi:hypothetical protein